MISYLKRVKVTYGNVKFVKFCLVKRHVLNLDLSNRNQPVKARITIAIITMIKVATIAM